LLYRRFYHRFVMTELTEGQLAPDITLPLDDGGSFQLSAHRGQFVVLYFYPQDDSGGCVTENEEFSGLATEFEALGAKVVGISPDTLESHARFRAKYGLTLPLAADPERLAIDAYGLWQLKKLYGREFMGLIRTTFIIDQDGRVMRIVRATKIRGHAQKVLDALSASAAKAAG
jgi:peroxiredoxin Q/BCP